ncbi:MAG: response regulator [Mediterranea sp.]|jgi:signal transduction histidine kinase/DNA-binding response OmpR family regulator/ligand-binding sensor domain-containing protein|nr:response regulator [Mediterranea sp.]
MKHTIAHLLFCLFTVTAVAQPVCDIRYYSVDDGMVQNIVNGMVQDSRGFHWIATRNGINKFDGHTFKNFKPSAQHEYAQANNRITFIGLTIDDNIWCRTYDDKLYHFDTRTETFRNIFEAFEAEIHKTIRIEEIYHTGNGILWLVCNDGYCFRIDEHFYGKEGGFAVYNTSNKQFKGTRILRIYQDDDGDEWILTDKGATILGRKRLVSDTPFRLMYRHGGKTYLVSTAEKLAVYLPQSGSVRFIELPYPVKHIHALQTLHRRWLALATDNGLIVYDADNETFRQIDVRVGEQRSNNVILLYEDHTGDCWVFTDEAGIVRFNLATDEKQHLYTPRNEVVNYGRNSRRLIFEDPQKNLWVLPFKGNLSYFDRNTRRLCTYYDDPDDPNSAFTPLVRFTHTDRQGNQWLIGARGIQKMSFFPQRFTLHRTDEKGTEVRALLHHRDSSLWVASKSDYVRIYHADGRLKGYLNPQGNIVPQATKFDNVYCFHRSPDGIIWIGTKEHGLFRLIPVNANSYRLYNYRHDAGNPYSLSADDVYTLFTDSRGQTWAGCYSGGLNLVRTTTQGTIEFVHSGNELTGYPQDEHQKVRTLTQTADSVMLLGTTDGLVSFSNRFDRPEEIAFYANRFNVADTANLVGRDVMHIFTDSRDDTYVLTYTGGVNKIISDNLLTEHIRFKSYTPRNGLASDLLMSMIEDSRGQLWLVSENSLTKFDARRETFDNYGRMFLHNDFSFTEAIPTFNARNQLVFGTDAGFLEVTPNKFTKSNNIPPMAFTELRIHGHPSSLPINDITELRLSPAQRNVSLRFVALDYIRPEYIQYAYRLKGAEEQWNYNDGNRQANYLNLAPGKYELEVRSTNSDGVWVNNLRTLPFYVVPTFWETGWAWLVYLLALVLCTTTIIYIVFYIYRLRHEVTVEHRLSDMKLRFFTDISHELRTPLTLITTPVGEVLENNTLSPTVRRQLTLVHKNTERMLHLVNQILDFRKIQNKKMKLLLERVELVAYVRQVAQNFDGLAEEKEMDYRFDADSDEIYAWADCDKLEKIIFNLLSNAFKYTLPGKAVSIRLYRQGEQVVIAVSDQGIGIAPDKLASLFKRFETLVTSNIMQPSSGIGLSLAKELVELHHGTISVESSQGLGSTFSVTLPVDRSAFAKDDYVEFLLTDSRQTDRRFAPLQPVAEEPVEEPVEEVEPVEAMDSPDDRRHTLLIVEDNADLKQLLESMLHPYYHTVEADNGKEGMEQARLLLPDLIITDVMMPVMDGIEMIRQIKADKETCHIPIIVLSARSSLADRIEGIEQGIDDYITKPFSSSYLKARIATLFENRRQLQELFISKLSAARPDISSALQPAPPQVIPHDEQFIRQVMEYMEEQMDNSELIIEDFAAKLCMSRSLFYRKLKSITGFSPIEFVREIRFKRAIQLMDSGYNFQQIAYMVGYQDPKFFSKSFKKHMGMTMREYRLANKNQSQ